MGTKSVLTLIVISGALVTVSCAISENTPRDIDGLMFELLMTKLEEMESRILSHFDERINLLEQNNAVKMKDMTERINRLEQNNALKMKGVTERINQLEQSIATQMKEITKQMGTVELKTEVISKVQNDLRSTIKDSLQSLQMKNQHLAEGAVKQFLLSSEALASSIKRRIDQTTGSGIFTIPFGQEGFVSVYRNTSNSHEYGNGWIVVQNRFEGKVEFNRSWSEYRYEFGNKDGEQWLGLKWLYEILQTGRYELLIMFEKWSGYVTYAHYDNFSIGTESEQYAVKSLGKYTGSYLNAYMKLEVGSKFSTYDKGNLTSCPQATPLGWWMKSCDQYHINYPYVEGKGVSYPYKYKVYLWKSTRMMIRLHE